MVEDTAVPCVVPLWQKLENAIATTLESPVILQSEDVDDGEISSMVDRS